MNSSPHIQFGPKDEITAQRNHNDLLVVTTEKGGYDVVRIFVDNGSSWISCCKTALRWV